LQETLAAKDKQLAELLDKVDISKKKEAELRDIILDRVGDENVTDQEVIQAFCELRQNVQQLASSSAFDHTAVLQPKAIQSPLKANIFAILDAGILNSSFTGMLQGLQREFYDGNKGATLKEMEHELNRFKSLLEHRRGLTFSGPFVNTELTLNHA
jgi:hypothetical protein